MAAAFAQMLGEALLRVVKFLNQTLIAFRLFKRREVLALEVFNQPNLKRDGIRHLTDNDRHLMQLRLLRGAPAALPRHNLKHLSVWVILICLWPHQKRLNHPMLLDGCSQLL